MSTGVTLSSIPWVEPMPGTGLVRTVRPSLLARAGSYSMLLPAGTVSDGASVPDALWGLLEADPIQMLVPGLFHDQAVRRGATIRDWGSDEERPIQDADEAFRIMDDVMRYCGVGDLDRAKCRWTLKVMERTYWHRKPLDWDGAA